MMKHKMIAKLFSPDDMEGIELEIDAFTISPRSRFVHLYLPDPNNNTDLVIGEDGKIPYNGKTYSLATVFMRYTAE